MCTSDLSEPDPFGAAPFNLSGTSKGSKGAGPPRPNQLPLSSSGLPDHDITSYTPLYSEETDIELQVRHRHSSENSSASHEGSQSVHSSRSGKDIFTVSFTRTPAEDRSKYEKLLNDDFEMRSPCEITDLNNPPEKVPPIPLDASASSCNVVEFPSVQEDSDSIGSASDLRERVDSSGEEDASSIGSDGDKEENISNNIPTDLNTCTEYTTEKLNKKSPGIKDTIQDVFIGHAESGRPLLDEESSDDDDQNEALLPGSKKGSNSSSLVVSPMTTITPPASPGEKSRSLDVFGAAPFKRLTNYSNPAKAPLLSPEEKEVDVFAQAPFKIPFKGQKDSFKNSLKKKKEIQNEGANIPRSSENFGSAHAIFLPDVVPNVEPPARKSLPCVKYTPRDNNSPTSISTSPVVSTDLFGSAPFTEISEKDINVKSTPKVPVLPNSQSLPCPSNQISNIVITYQKQIAAPQQISSPAPIPPPSSSTSIIRRKSNQDLFGAVPFSSVAPALVSQKKLPPPVAPKPKLAVRSASMDPTPSSSLSRPISDNGNISRDSSGSFSSESLEESKLTSSVDKSKYKELIEDDTMAHDENVNVLSSRHYTQLKPVKKSRHSKRKEAKERISSTNAFSNMSFEDIVSDDESQYTQSFIRDSSSIKRTSNSFR
ncbi:hypothetical protein X975_00908, partial [Stegodyphus mimosarum]